MTKIKAPAVFSSDALSSVAYATKEVLLMLMVAGTAGLRYDLPIGFVILALLVIVTFSYRQMIFAYPSGGGSYIVSKEPSRRIPLWSVGFAALAIAEWRISRVSPRWVQILFHSSWPGGLGIDSPV